MGASPHILLFDPYASGHHRMYLELLVRYWVDNELSGQLEILVSQAFEERHGQFCDFVRSSGAAGVSLSVFRAPAHQEGIASLKEVFRNDLASGRILARHIRGKQPDHVLLMMFDHCQVSLASRFLRKTRFSGIFFRPTFQEPPASNTGVDLRPTKLFKTARFSRLILLRLAVFNPALKNLFCLDPRCVVPVKRMRKNLEVLPLPDGYSVTPSIETAQIMRDKLGVDVNRKIVLFFGVVSARKGIFETLDAVMALPFATGENTCLLIAGRIDPEERIAVLSAIERVQSDSPVQVINVDRFVEESEIGCFFEAASAVMVTYRNHVGSSNVLIRAAAAGKPVVGTSKGLVGQWIRRHRLGIDVPSDNTVMVAEALQSLLSESDTAAFDPNAARSFADGHSASAFANTIFSAMTTD